MEVTVTQDVELAGRRLGTCSAVLHHGVPVTGHPVLRILTTPGALARTITCCPVERASSSPALKRVSQVTAKLHDLRRANRVRGPASG
jgi:hypothetical protein